MVPHRLSDVVIQVGAIESLCLVTMAGSRSGVYFRNTGSQTPVMSEAVGRGVVGEGVESELLSCGAATVREAAEPAVLLGPSAQADSSKPGATKRRPAPWNGSTACPIDAHMQPEVPRQPSLRIQDPITHAAGCVRSAVQVRAIRHHARMTGELAQRQLSYGPAGLTTTDEWLTGAVGFHTYERRVPLGTGSDRWTFAAHAVKRWG